MNHKDTAKIIKYTRKIETLLGKLGAEGKGLHGKISSIEDMFPKQTIKQLRWIASIRNNSMHDHNFKIKSINDFSVACDTVIQKLKNSNNKTTYYTKNNQILKQSYKASGSKKYNTASSTTIQNYNSDNTPLIISAILIITFIASVWWFLSGDTEEEIMVNIGIDRQVIAGLNKKINIITTNIRQINNKIDVKKENQGLLRNIFNDTDVIDNLESKKEKFEEEKKLLLQKLGSTQDELEELLNKKQP